MLLIDKYNKDIIRYSMLLIDKYNRDIIGYHILLIDTLVVRKKKDVTKNLKLFVLFLCVFDF